MCGDLKAISNFPQKAKFVLEDLKTKNAIFSRFHINHCWVMFGNESLFFSGYKNSTNDLTNEDSVGGN